MKKFKVGDTAPFLTRDGVYRWIVLRTQRQADHVNRDMVKVQQGLRNKFIIRATKPHPVLPEARKRNANQPTCNKISGKIKQLKLTF